MVVYRIVTEHKATLHVDTRPGEGTRFTISLPVHQKPVRLLEKAAPAQA
jgi:signal transduction histidine kinase